MHRIEDSVDVEENLGAAEKDCVDVYEGQDEFRCLLLLLAPRALAIEEGLLVTIEYPQVHNQSHANQI